MSKILVVDDNEQNRYLLKTILTASNHETLQAGNGSDALEQARRNVPDLIISDILMPQMDGFAFCRECKSDEQLREIPFIFYTATYTDPRDRDLGLRLGAARFIIKPTENAEFVAIVHQVLDEYTEGRISAPALATEEETVFYRLYNEALVRKLEEKVLVLERTNSELMRAYDTTIAGWSRALDLRDKETEGHTQRVTDLTLKLARKAGMNENELVHVRRGALLHDIGKIAIPDAILLKPAKLDAQEWELMRRHPQFAYDMLTQIAYLRPALDIPYCHHEKWDGTGYPRGLKGEQIPLAARLFAVVDVWDALRSDRPYRQGWADAQVYEHIRAESGAHFDPSAVELFFQVQKELADETESHETPTRNS